MSAPAHRHLTPGQLAKIFDVCHRTVCGWIDRRKLHGELLPGARHRRVRIEVALEFAREHDLPTEELETLAIRAGLGVVSCPTLLVYSPCPTLVAHFAAEGFAAEPVSDPFFVGILLYQRRFEAVLVDQAVGSAEASTRIGWIGAHLPDTRRVLLANEDDPRAGWQGDDYYRRPVHLGFVAEELMAKLRPGRKRAQAAKKRAA